MGLTRSPWARSPEAREIVRATASSFRDRPLGPEEGHFASGPLGGGLLLNAYLQKWEPTPEREELLEGLLDVAESAASRVHGLGLYSGLCGIGWLLTHVGQILETKVDCSEIDSLVLEALRQQWGGHFDLISGLVGIGYYGIERAHLEAGRRIVSVVVLHLAEQFEYVEGGGTWWTRPDQVPPLYRADYPRGWHDLGPSHGAAGVICFLAEAIRLGIRADQASHMIECAVPWLAAQLHSVGGRYTLPARAHGPNTPRDVRLAWCYNELGSMCAVLRAGDVLRRREWVDLAHFVAKPLAEVPTREGGVNEAPFCHGAAGVAFLFGAFESRFHDPSFGVAREIWLRRVLDFADQSSREGRFYFHDRSNGTVTRRHSRGLLEGDAGVALVLLAFEYGEMPEWGRMFGLSPELVRAHS